MTSRQLLPFQKAVRAAPDDSTPLGPPPSPTATHQVADTRLMPLKALVPPLGNAGTFAVV